MPTFNAYTPISPTMGSITSESLAKARQTALPNFFGRTPEAADVLLPINFAKVPGADPFIQSQFGGAAALQNALAQDTARYRAGIEATQPRVGEFATQELGDLGNLFSPGGYEARLANIPANRARAMANLTNTLFGDIRRQSGLDTAMGGGVSGAGLGSYLLSRAGSTAGKLRTQEAYDAAAQERADVMDLLGARTAAQGKRQLLTDAVLARLFQPADKEIAAQAAHHTALQAAMNNALANAIQAFGTSVA